MGGAQCSCVCSQETRATEVLDKYQRLNKGSTYPNLNISLDSDESIILDPVEILTKSLIRRYLAKKFLKSIPLFQKFLQPGKVIYGPPKTNSQISKLENSLTPYNAKRSTTSTVDNFHTVLLYDGSYYLGQWDISQQKPDGFGTIVYQDGSKYTGDFKSGKKLGKGRLINIEGDVYEGEFYNDKKQGIGILKKSNGTLYKGGFLGGLEQGEGVLELLGKVVYAGGFDKGLKHGYGKLNLGENSYTGDFAYDMMDGNGVYI